MLRTVNSDQEHIHHTGSVHVSLLSRTVFLNNYVPIKFHGNVTSPPTLVIVVRDLYNAFTPQIDIGACRHTGVYSAFGLYFCVYFLLRASLRLLHLKMSRVYLALYSVCIAIMFQYSYYCVCVIE